MNYNHDEYIGSVDWSAIFSLAQQGVGTAVNIYGQYQGLKAQQAATNDAVKQAQIALKLKELEVEAAKINQGKTNVYGNVAKVVAITGGAVILGMLIFQK